MLTPSSPLAAGARRARRTRRLLTALTAAAAASLLLAACAAMPPRDFAASSPPTGASHTDAIRSSHGWDGLGPRELIAALETIPVDQRPADLHTSITPHEVSLTRADGIRESIELPDDAFYLSFAPYRTTTHECFAHSPTGCIGEFGDTAFHVRIVDRSSGAVLVDDTLTSSDNGFIGVWLPRNIDADLTVERDGSNAHAQIRTGTDDPTCLTTLRLS